MTVHGCTVRSPLAGSQATSRPLDRFSRYSKWPDTFRTALVFFFCWSRAVCLKKSSLERSDSAIDCPIILFSSSSTVFPFFLTVQYNVTYCGYRCCPFLHCTLTWLRPNGSLRCTKKGLDLCTATGFSVVRTLHRNISKREKAPQHETAIAYLVTLSYRHRKSRAHDCGRSM